MGKTHRQGLLDVSSFFYAVQQYLVVLDVRYTALTLSPSQLDVGELFTLRWRNSPKMQMSENCAFALLDRAPYNPI